MPSTMTTNKITKESFLSVFIKNFLQLKFILISTVFLASFIFSTPAFSESTSNISIPFLSDFQDVNYQGAPNPNVVCTDSTQCTPPTTAPASLSCEDAPNPIDACCTQENDFPADPVKNATCTNACERYGDGSTQCCNSVHGINTNKCMCRVDFQNSDGCCGIGAESTDEFIGTPTCICRALGDDPNNPTQSGCCRATGSNNASCICLEKGARSTACICATDPSSEACLCRQNPSSPTCICKSHGETSQKCKCAKNPNLLECRPLEITARGKCVTTHKRVAGKRHRGAALYRGTKFIEAEIPFLTTEPNGKKKQTILNARFPLKALGLRNISPYNNPRIREEYRAGAGQTRFLRIYGFPEIESVQNVKWYQSDGVKPRKRLHVVLMSHEDKNAKTKIVSFRNNKTNRRLDFSFSYAMHESMSELYPNCEGHYSPLMAFFNDKRPHFKNTSNLILGKTPTYWPEKNHPGFFLAVDNDNDNKLTKSSEIFGNTDGFKNGFERLKLVDSNKDNVIDRRDKVFSKLVLWKDKNGNGIGEKSELIPLKEKGVLSISLNNSPPRIKQYGKRAEGREESVFSYRDKKGKIRKNKIIDIWFSPVLETRTLAKTDNKESPHEVNKNKFYKKGVPF